MDYKENANTRHLPKTTCTSLLWIIRDMQTPGTSQKGRAHLFMDQKGRTSTRHTPQRMFISFCMDCKEHANTRHLPKRTCTSFLWIKKDVQALDTPQRGCARPFFMGYKGHANTRHIAKKTCTLNGSKRTCKHSAHSTRDVHVIFYRLLRTSNAERLAISRGFFNGTSCFRCFVSPVFQLQDSLNSYGRGDEKSYACLLRYLV